MTGPPSQESGLGSRDERPLRVIQWGVGAVGLHALRFIIDSEDLELAGVKCFTDAKVGVDAGHLAGTSETGVRATNDIDVLLHTEADCVIYMPRDVFLDPTLPGSPSSAWVDEVVAILRSGKNVVSPLQSAMHWRQLADGATLKERLEEACRVGASSVFFTGLDPGFVSDVLAITYTSAAGLIEQVRTLEVIDYDGYPSPDTLSSMGFGRPPAESSAPSDDQPDTALVSSWGCALWLVADALGVTLDDIVLSTESLVASEAFTSQGGLTILPGQVAAMKWSLTGVVDGRALIVSTHVARMGEHLAPQWPHVGERGGYVVEVDASPPLRAELPLGLPGGTGTCLGDAVVMTAARCVNAVGVVVEASAGYRLLSDLPTFGGRHSYHRRG